MEIVNKINQYFFHLVFKMLLYNVVWACGEGYLVSDIKRPVERFLPSFFPPQKEDGNRDQATPVHCGERILHYSRRPRRVGLVEESRNQSLKIPIRNQKAHFMGPLWNVAKISPTMDDSSQVSEVVLHASFYLPSKCVDLENCVGLAIFPRLLGPELVFMFLFVFNHGWSCYKFK